MTESGQKCGTVALLELVEAGAIEDSGKHGFHVDRALVIYRDDPIELMLREQGLLAQYPVV